MTNVPVLVDTPARPVREAWAAGRAAGNAWLTIPDAYLAEMVAAYMDEVNKVEEGHSGEITDIQLSPDGTYFITSSKDKSAKVS